MIRKAGVTARIKTDTEVENSRGPRCLSLLCVLVLCMVFRLGIPAVLRV